MFGILNVYKPPGITSRDAVNQVYRVVRPNKAGHAGTLDPIACGVLLIPIGSAARLVPYLHLLPKSYTATFVLGQSSDSDDSETAITHHRDLQPPLRGDLQQAARSMQGRVMQRPPAYSAIKVAGKRSYKLARQGDVLMLPERPVRIDRIEIIRYEFPELEIEIDCGSGTYVRSIGRDLAQAVGTKAVMTALTRTAIGPFTIDKAIAVEELNLQSLTAALEPAARGVLHLPRIILNRAEVTEIINGRGIPMRPIDPGSGNDCEEIAALDETGQLRAILHRRAAGLAPKRVFPAAIS